MVPLVIAHRGDSAHRPENTLSSFEEALRIRKYREAHQQALRHAYQEAGVTGVPMFVIGRQVLTGLQDRETLEAVIEEERKTER